jgi:hypothetical protein
VFLGFSIASYPSPIFLIDRDDFSCKVKLINPPYIMNIKNDLTSKEGSIHQDEYPQKNVKNPMFKGVSVEKQQLYLSYAAKDDEWKSFHAKQLLRKVDIRLIPLLILMYLLNFLDRSNLAQARLGTLEEDLKMKGTDFNLATSILFVVGSWCKLILSYIS